MTWLTEKTYQIDGEDIRNLILRTLEYLPYPGAGDFKLLVRMEVGAVMSRESRDKLRTLAKAMGKRVIFAGFDHEED